MGVLGKIPADAESTIQANAKSSDALLSTTGYSRATQNEIRRWEEKQLELQHSLDAAYDEGTANSAEAKYIHFIER